MTDLHTHILPGVDDGAKSVEESLEMLRASARSGVDTVALTPHFYADRDDPCRFLKRRDAALERLKAAMEASGESFPRLILGAEVAYFEGIADCEELSLLRLSGTRLILIEMPWIRWNERMIEEVCSIYERTGLIPVIAHIDRYAELFRDRRIGEVFWWRPVLVQANASFFADWRYKRLALKMMERGQIHLLGTDCHNMTTRPPCMEKALAPIDKRLGGVALQYFAAVEKKAFSPETGVAETSVPIQFGLA